TLFAKRSLKRNFSEVTYVGTHNGSGCFAVLGYQTKNRNDQAAVNVSSYMDADDASDNGVPSLYSDADIDVNQNGSTLNVKYSRINEVCADTGSFSIEHEGKGSIAMTATAMQWQSQDTKCGNTQPVSGACENLKLFY